ncbi:MAG: acyl-CoA/acyl-ACP dehydrogenase [Thermoleophilaceae bacterium]|nr:acyl-CoA/acyl-ACP dehydrogenase [Thermoleophilaceae bacterium]
MPIELAARTEPGARLVAIAERLSEQLAARAAEHDREASYPFEAIDALKAAGYFAAPVPVELGGLGVSSAHDLVVASSRLARGDASVAIGVNMHLVAVQNMERRRQVAFAAGQARRAQGFASSLERIARDEIVLAAAISERGQDLTRPGTRAARTDCGWRIDAASCSAQCRRRPPTSTWRSPMPTARVSSATPTRWCPPTPPAW